MSNTESKHKLAENYRNGKSITNSRELAANELARYLEIGLPSVKVTDADATPRDVNQIGREELMMMIWSGIAEEHSDPEAYVAQVVLEVTEALHGAP